MSSTPTTGPKAKAVSYSRPPEAWRYCGRLTMVKWSSSMCAMRPQAMVQPKQALLVIRLRWPLAWVSIMAAGLILSTPSNWTSLKLRVGRPPNSCMESIIALVPYSVRPLRPSLSARSALVSLTAAMKRLGSSTPTPTVPCTAIALRFLEPITAPTPERPAARCRSLTTQAK